MAVRAISGSSDKNHRPNSTICKELPPYAVIPIVTGHRLLCASPSFGAQPKRAESPIGSGSAIGSGERGRRLVAIDPLHSFHGGIVELLFGDPH